MRRLFLLLAIFFANAVHSQSVKVINSAGVKNLPKAFVYAFLEPSIDTMQVQYVATILAKDKNRQSVIEGLYSEIRKKATELGANCFLIKSFARDTLKHESVLILDSYYASDSIINLNTSKHDKNVVYVFGEEREGEKTMTFNLNGEKKEIVSGTYYKINLTEGKDVMISKGGVAGESVTLSWMNDKQTLFFTLSGFGLSRLADQPAFGVGFNTGKINRIGNVSLGLLLTKLLKPGN